MISAEEHDEACLVGALRRLTLAIDRGQPLIQSDVETYNRLIGTNPRIIHDKPSLFKSDKPIIGLGALGKPTKPCYVPMNTPLIPTEGDPLLTEISKKLRGEKT